MKTPNEIKKALECCNEEGRCHECPYDPTGDHNCNCQKNDDAMAYIQQLEAQRDAAVNDLGVVRDCKVCKHYDHTPNEAPCRHCGIAQANWEWRGVKEDTHEQ